MKQLDLNNSKDLTSLKESLNAVIDKKIAEQQLTEKLNSLKGLSFGEYKSLFESVMSDLCDSVEGKKILGSYVSLIKENKAINSVYRVLEGTGFNNCDDATITAYTVGGLLENINKKQLLEGEKKMYNILMSACQATGKVITCESIDNTLNENKVLNNAVSYLSHKANSTSVKSINEKSNSIKALSDFINECKQNPGDVITESKTNSELMSDLNSLLENNAHSEWENAVINDIMVCSAAGGDKSQLFETYKNKCISIIDEMDDDDDVNKKARLHGMKQQLMEKKYNQDTLIDDLFRLAELSETLNEE